MYINNNNFCKCGYKKFENRDYCCFLCYKNKGHNKLCAGKENNTIIIGSEGCGYTNSYYFINYLIYLYNPNLKVIFRSHNAEAYHRFERYHFYSGMKSYFSDILTI